MKKNHNLRNILLYVGVCMGDKWYTDFILGVKTSSIEGLLLLAPVALLYLALTMNTKFELPGFNEDKE